MSIHQKLRSPQSDMSRLKLLWRDSLAEPERDYWRNQFESTIPQAKLRQELQTRYHIHLRRDNQLNRFRAWVQELDAQREEVRLQAADQAELEQQGLTGEQLREELLNRMKRRALSRGDFQLGLKAVAADLKSDALHLDMKKFTFRLRTKLSHDPALANRPGTETVSPSPAGAGEGRGEGARASRTNAS